MTYLAPTRILLNLCDHEENDSVNNLSIDKQNNIVH